MYRDTTTSQAAVQDTSWRAGRPVEDPQKTKRWGFITAKPSEFLVHVRKGRVLERSSGQGATCFKWPWDAVAIVPTSLQQLRFKADQVTLEKVGVEVVGLAVFRISDPLTAYRVLNFSYPERAQQKLEETLTAMFVGATRRLVANLTIEDCMQKRKYALSDELLREIALVVGGEGMGTRGWGVVLDTIEVQEVRVLSDKVFSAMQAPFRAALDRKAREARTEAEREIATREADANRSIEQARIQAQLEIGEKQASYEQALLEATKLKSLREADVEREVSEAKALAEASVTEKRTEIERKEAEQRAHNAIAVHQLAVLEAQAENEAYATRSEALARRMELEKIAWVAELEHRRAEIEVVAAEGRVEAENALAQARADREQAEARARVLTAENLPSLASAVGQRFGEVKVVQMGGEGNAFSSIAQAIMGVLEVAKAS
jgi:regulator of protease activity HflC (stomatin/prohibitin superfamily)